MRTDPALRARQPRNRSFMACSLRDRARATSYGHSVRTWPYGLVLLPALTRSSFSNPHPRRAPDPASIALGVAPTTKTAMQRFMQTGANAVRTAILNRAALPASQVRDSRPGRAAKRDIREAVGFSAREIGSSRPRGTRGRGDGGRFAGRASRAWARAPERTARPERPPRTRRFARRPRPADRSLPRLPRVVGAVVAHVDDPTTVVLARR